MKPGSQRRATLFARALFRLRERLDRWLRVAPRVAVLRLLGMQIGPGTSLSRVHVTWPHQVAIGARCRIEHDCFFKFDGTWAPGPSIVIGDDGFVGVGCEFNIRQGLRVGRQALIASRCVFIDHDHGFASRALPMGLQTDGIEAAITLEDDVWLGAGCIVLKGVTVGRGAIVAAGSVLTRSVGAYEIWAGVPARKLRDRPPGAAPTVPGAPP